jgi:hypothetical protein
VGCAAALERPGVTGVLPYDRATTAARVALHIGAAHVRDGDCFGPTLNARGVSRRDVR